MNSNPQTIPVSMGRPSTQNGTHAPAVSEEVQHARAYHTPLIDIHEGLEGLVLEADIPGASENNLSIQLEDNVLSLHAQVDSMIPEGARALHEEYRVADYYRSFILSDEVERAKISAELKNGVLRLHLPKAERAKTRRIEIKS